MLDDACIKKPVERSPRAYMTDLGIIGKLILVETIVVVP